MKQPIVFINGKEYEMMTANWDEGKLINFDIYEDGEFKTVFLDHEKAIHTDENGNKLEIEMFMEVDSPVLGKDDLDLIRKVGRKK